MTILVAVKLKDRILLGCDSLITNGEFKITPPNYSKIVEVSPSLLIAFTGSTMAYHILSDFAKKKPKPQPPKDANEAFKLARSIFALYKEEMEKSISYKPNAEDGIEIVICTPDNIINCSETSCEIADSYLAAGTGMDYALGSLYNDHARKRLNEKSVSIAISAAVCYNVSCGNPIVIREILRND